MQRILRSRNANNRIVVCFLSWSGERKDQKSYFDRFKCWKSLRLYSNFTGRSKWKSRDLICSFWLQINLRTFLHSIQFIFNLVIRISRAYWFLMHSPPPLPPYQWPSDCEPYTNQSYTGVWVYSFADGTGWALFYIKINKYGANWLDTTDKSNCLYCTVIYGDTKFSALIEG